MLYFYSFLEMYMLYSLLPNISDDHFKILYYTNLYLESIYTHLQSQTSAGMHMPVKYVQLRLHSFLPKHSWHIFILNTGSEWIINLENTGKFLNDTLVKLYRS